MHLRNSQGRPMTDAPLAGLLVLDLSQFLSGPSSALRLGDLGARVIKVERPDGGDLTRRLYLSDTGIGGDSTLFHAINRGKESIALDYKDATQRAALMRLVGRADVVIQNFRPGVAERLGIGPDMLTAANPRLVCGVISGYGPDGDWAHLPGQDLLAQARSGVMWLTGRAGDGPVPMGLAVADLLAGAALTQGILAALVRRGVTGRGGVVRTSLLEALVDFQFEVLTTHLNDGGRLPARAVAHGAHAWLAAPYGVYRCADGWLALAMTPLPRLAQVLDLPALADLPPGAGFARRDEILTLIAAHLATQPLAHWLALAEATDLWAAPVMDWPALLESKAFQGLELLQTVTGPHGSLRTTRAPITIDGWRPGCIRAAPAVDEQGAAIRAEFGL